MIYKSVKSKVFDGSVVAIIYDLWPEEIVKKSVLCKKKKHL